MEELRRGGGWGGGGWERKERGREGEVVESTREWKKGAEEGQRG